MNIMKVLLSMFLLGCSMIANSNDTLTINVDSKQSNFTVTLKANPTTGYQWSVVKYDKKLLTLSGSQYQKPNTKLIGAGGQMVFTFTLNKGKSYPASTDMVFKYARSWEPDSATVQNVTIQFGSPSS